MLTKRAIPLLTLCMLTACAKPPVQPVARVTLAPGQTIEVAGLRRWSVKMIEDSLAKYVPGETLLSHACMANLRFKLGFADAYLETFSVESIMDTDTTHTSNIILLVREPQDSNLVNPVTHAIDDS